MPGVCATAKKEKKDEEKKEEPPKDPELLTLEGKSF